MALSGTNSNSSANTWSGVNTFNSDCLKVNNIYALGTRFTLKDSSTSTLDIFFNNKNGTSINGWVTLDPNGVGNPASQGVAIWGDFRVEGATEITSALKLTGTNTDTTASSGQKLAVLNTTTNTIERINITPDNLATLSGTQTITGAKSFNSDCLKVNNIYALGSSLTVKNSSATSFDVIFNSKFTNPEPGWLTIDPNNSSAASSGVAYYGNLCVQENTEIMKILALSGTNTDTATSSGQKLTVLNTSTHAVERVNITANNVATLSGTQTFSGDKTFTGTVNLGTVNASGRISSSYAINTTTSFQTVTTLNSTGMYLMTASTNAADGTHGLYYICMEESGLVATLSGNNFAFQFVSGTTLQVRTVSQGFNNCEINILRLK